MESGKICVEVYTSRAKIPVVNGTVLFILNKTNQDMAMLPNTKDIVIAIELTNSSGQTRSISIPSPSSDFSSSPSGETPYTLLDIWVEQPDFVSKKLEGVQVFPNVETLQAVELTPLLEGQSSLDEEVQVELSPQDL